MVFIIENLISAANKHVESPDKIDSVLGTLITTDWASRVIFGSKWTYLNHEQ